jgi:5,10-methylenetetrahydrofolate reductase
MALKEAIKEYIYLINILKLLKIHNNNSNNYYLFCDNQPAIKLAKNPEYHSKSKHIDIQYHYVREKIIEGIINLDYIKIKE